MKWEELKAAGVIEIDNQSFSLIHLQDKVYRYTIDAIGSHSQLFFEVLVQYSSHCITEGQKRHEPPIEKPDLYDDRHVPRVFSPERYKLSLLLPDVFTTFLMRTCYFTGYDNWLTIEIIDEQGVNRDYEIYFRVHQETSRFLRLYVESAYVRSEENMSRKPKHFTRREKVKAKTLLTKKLRKESLFAPRRK
ncbi:hypothetical protein ACFORL_11630 [Legionella dresdenensis]|uniref:Uncharacterized protein n=1 Tax=Legionella dresdenensis TaxID=450200 RepID=A0ABV8CHH6_9GAMM